MSSFRFTVHVFLISLTLLLTGGNRFMTTAASDPVTGLEIIPKPALMRPGDGTFTITPATVIVVTDETRKLRDLGRYLSDEIRKFSGYSIEVCKTPGAGGTGQMVLSTKGADAALGKEGYVLEVTTDGVRLTAPEPAGVFYGIQTVLQILMSRNEDNTTAMSIPCVYVEDKPRYSWRGMQLDCSRHFMSVDFVKRYIDLLAFHKLNVFHWHLTDDQGWRLEIKRYPGLTETGAWRGEGEHRHGGYYTQEEVREVVRYARSRYVTVVPEIEMPGHATAAIAAYPELSCEGKRIPVETTWGIHTNLFCAGKESTFEFIENVLREVCELFPSQYIHIGGDEAKKDKWKACPYCRKRIRDEGLKDENELQGYFTRRIDAFMQSMGKTVIGWDEILEGGPSKTAIVQSWRGMEGAIEGTKKGHRVISSPYTHVYLDFPNMDEGVHDTGWLKVTTLEKTYSFEPTPEELTEKEAALVLGGEAPLWSERTPQPEVDNNVFPRLCAFSEAVWTPGELKSWPDFSERMKAHFRRLDALGVDYFKPAVKVGEWKGNQLSGSFKTLEWDITDHLAGPGHYRFTVRHDRGGNDVIIRWAAVLEDGREIARDTHEGMSGERDRAHNYRFRLHTVREGRDYTLKVSMRSEGGNDSAGSILMRRFH